MCGPGPWRVGLWWPRLDKSRQRSKVWILLGFHLAHWMKNLPKHTKQQPSSKLSEKPPRHKLAFWLDIRLYLSFHTSPKSCIRQSPIVPYCPNTQCLQISLSSLILKTKPWSIHQHLLVDHPCTLRHIFWLFKAPSLCRKCLKSTSSNADLLLHSKSAISS